MVYKLFSDYSILSFGVLFFVTLRNCFIISHYSNFRIIKLVKSHRKPGRNYAISGTVNGGGEWYMLSLQLSDNMDIFRSQCHHGIYQKSGVYDGPDGQQYKGDWMDDNRSGMGVQHMLDGRRYEGEWMDDKCNGMGVMLDADGSTFRGEFRNDKRVFGVFTPTNRIEALVRYNDDDKEIQTATLSGDPFTDVGN